MKVLLDENVMYYADGLRLVGYDVVTITELQAKGWSKRTDYSVLKLAEKEGYVVITNDDEVYDGARENDIPVVRALQLRKLAAIEWIVERLKEIEHLRKIE